MEAIFNTVKETLEGGTVASWLVRSSRDRPVRVRAPAGDIVLFSWRRHFTLTVPLYTKGYKWVPGIRYDGLASHRGGC